jgi:hypothetical protein
MRSAEKTIKRGVTDNPNTLRSKNRWCVAPIARHLKLEAPSCRYGGKEFIGKIGEKQLLTSTVVARYSAEFRMKAIS